MTYEEIIKSLKICGNSRVDCSKCAYEGCANCVDTLEKDALELIKRQNTEIEFLKIANEKMYIANQEQQAENEHFEAEIKGLKRFIEDLIKDEVKS